MVIRHCLLPKAYQDCTCEVCVMIVQSILDRRKLQKEVAVPVCAIMTYCHDSFSCYLSFGLDSAGLLGTFLMDSLEDHGFTKTERIPWKGTMLQANSAFKFEYSAQTNTLVIRFVHLLRSVECRHL